MVRGGEHALVLHVNVHCLNLSYHRPWLRDLLNGVPKEITITQRHIAEALAIAALPPSEDIETA